MCFKMDLRCDSHSHSARLFLAALSSRFFPFNGSPTSGTAVTTCARAMLVHPGSEHNVLLTVHNPDSVPTHLSKRHHHREPGPCVTGNKNSL